MNKGKDFFFFFFFFLFFFHERAAEAFDLSFLEAFLSVVVFIPLSIHINVDRARVLAAHQPAQMLSGVGHSAWGVQVHGERACDPGVSELSGVQRGVCTWCLNGERTSTVYKLSGTALGYRKCVSTM